MLEEIQPTTTNPGASNASDFQPPTRNPQRAQGQLFQQTSNIQQPEMEKVLQNGNARINVPVNPAPAPIVVTKPKSYGGIIILLLIAGAVIILAVAHRLRKRISASTPPVQPQEAATPVPIQPPMAVKKFKSKSKKAVSKVKKPSKRKRR